MNIHDVVRVRIDDLTSSGWGVARVIDETPEGASGSAVVFVPFSVPGEIAMVRITEARKNHFRGEIVELLEPSPGRIDPPCPYFGKCPGCSLQHMSYDAQCEAKRNRMGRILSRAIGRETQPKFIRSPEQFGYRTHFSIGWANRGGEPLIGLTDPETRDIVDVASCMLIPDWANAGYSRLRDSLTAAAGQLPEHFRLRLFLDHEARQVYAVAPRGPKKEHRRVPSSLGSILARFPAPHTIERRVLGVTLRLHPASFVQANNYLTESLYAEGLQAAQPQGNDVVCELYSGSGFFTLALAPKVKRAVAIEADKRAVDNLAKSAEDVIRSMKRGKRKQEPDIQVAQGKAEDLAEEVMKEFKPTLVIANPPRSGLHPRVVEAVAKSEGVRRIVMISCDAATLARDVRGLMNAGFEAEEPVALDCYPQTVHVETVMALRR